MRENEIQENHPQRNPGKMYDGGFETLTFDDAHGRWSKVAVFLR